MKMYAFSSLAGMRPMGFILMLLTLCSAAVPCWGGNPSLNFSPELTLLPVKQSGTATDLFTFTGNSSFKGNVSLSVSGLPGGVTASWSSASLALTSGTGSSTLTLSLDSSVATNWYNYTVTASGDGLTVSRSYTLQVRPAQAVQLELANSALSLWHGGKAGMPVTAAPMHGVPFATGAAAPSVQLVSSLPTGITSYWTGPSAVAGGGTSWYLHLAAAPTVGPGSYPVQVSAQVTDSQSGLVYTTSQNFTLLISLVGAATVSVGDTGGQAISANFMGLSQEWWEAQWMMGDAATGVNSIYRQLLANLTAYGSAPLNLRIGGESTDDSGEPTSITVTPLAELATATGVTFDLGVNLGSDDVGLAVDQAKNYIANMPAGSVDGLEIGNEPDLYAWDGHRAPTYTVQDYFADFATWKTNILAAVPPGTKVMGTAWASTGMLGNIGTFLSANSSAIGAFTQHGGVTSPSANPPADILLQPNSATMEPINVAAAVVQTHADGIPFRIGEIGSADDGAIPGISNAFGAALWEIDTMFEYASRGVDGLNWSTSIGDYNAPFWFAANTNQQGRTSYTLTSVNAPYYGLLFFQAATGHGAQLLPVNLSAEANLKAWATIDSSGTPRVVLINKDENYEGNVAISMPGYSQASVYRLTAPSYTSTSGIQFAGQTFDGSTDGTIQGTQQIQTINGTNGNFSVSIHTTTAALLVFSN